MISGYRMEDEIQKDPGKILHRGVREADGLQVVIKSSPKRGMSVEEIDRFKREYDLLQDLDTQGVASVCELRDEVDSFSLVMEHISGEPLRRLIDTRQMTLLECLQMAVQLSGVVAALHRGNVIHKNLNPADIFWDAGSSQVTLCGFEYASTLLHSTQSIESPAVPEGSLAYISPEQTGRMNRSVDYRTDLYSLGITFYEMWTHQVPFPADDPMEVVHSHLARKPMLSCEVNPDIPEVLSEIVMKLLEKNAEDRYQSAGGLQADLQYCLDQFQSAKRIEPFEIGSVDYSDALQIPEKLYGREREIEVLFDTYEEVHTGQAVLLLVAGYSGVGKTSLIQEIQKPILAKRGFFVSGKFDQFTRNIPYAALVSAFQELARKILTETDEQIAQWKYRLQGALGINGRVITDIIPEVAFIIGEQPEVPVLSPEAAQNRFHLVFQNFVRVFASADHPLTLFLDDLQWADSSSLDLLKHILTDRDLRHLLIMGAYRDNEVPETHPLVSTLEALRQAGTDIRTIELHPITSEHLNRLVSDALRQEAEQAREISDLVYDKTEGNPFYVKALLRSLYEQDLLIYDLETRSWRWDSSAIRQLGVADNVAELLAENLKTLSISLQRSLQYASCIGSQFDLHTVAACQGKTEAETARELVEALAQGFVLPVEDTAYGDVENQEASGAPVSYRFMHDRVQEAADQLLSDEERTIFQLEIGRQMLSDARRFEAQDKRIIDIVQYLNKGSEMIQSENELLELAELNLSAGRRARASAAFEQAYSFYLTGIRLLESDSWQRHYNLTLALYEEGTEAAYLCGDYGNSEHFFESVLENATSILDKVKVHEVKVMALMAEGRMQEAVRPGLDVLELLGMSIPENPNRESIENEIQAVLELLDRKSNREILEQTELTDPVKLAIHRILGVVVMPAFHFYHNLHLLLAAKLVRLSVEFGNSEYSPMGYGLFGAMFGGVVPHMQIANRMATLSLTLDKQLGAKENQTRAALVAYAFIRPWDTPLGETLKPLRESIHAGMEVGDIEYAARSMCFSSTFSILAGRDLNELVEEVEADDEFLARHGMSGIFEFNEFYRQCILNLLGRSQVPYMLIGEGYDETRSLQKDLASGHGNMIVLYSLFKLILCYLFGQYHQVVEYAAKAEAYLDDVAGMVFISFLPFYESLALLAIYPEQTAEEQKRIGEKISQNQHKIKEWAKFSPENQLHKYHLVEAERARVLGHHTQASEYYDKAIELAGAHGFVNDGALANELAGRFYEGQNRPRFVEVYMQEAYRLYQLWGAKAKTDDLSKRYPHLFDGSAGVRAGMRETSLDVDSIVKASQTFSEVSIVSDLLQRMMKIVMENAGAERGVLLLQKQGRWHVEAEATIDPYEINVLQSVPIDPAGVEGTQSLVSDGIVQYVIRTRERVVLDDAGADVLFMEDPYIRERQPKSMLCIPILHLGELLALLYLENNLVKGAFPQQQVQILELLSSQIAISLNNALRYEFQVQQFRYLYRLRSALGDAQTVEEVAHRTGETMLETLESAGLTGVAVAVDGRRWTNGVVEGEGQASDTRVLSWGERERGRLEVYGGVSFREPQEQALLDETMAQVSRVLEARELEMQLLQSGRLVSLGQMAAGVAHELNQPLGALSTTAEDYYLRLQEGMNVSDKQWRTMLKRMLGMTERMAGTVEHLRVFSRDTYQEPGIRFAVNDAVRSALDLIGAQLVNHGIEVGLDLREGLPEVVGHSHQLEQVFLNLLGNARDAVDEQVERMGDKEARENQVLVRSFVADDGMVVEVEDNGVGIEVEDVGRVFEPFFTTKAADRGTGLGLSISYAIVKNHGGEITCESVRGEGTVFRVMLPVEENTEV